MTEPTPPEDDNTLAAEYALGVLDAAGRAQVQARIKVDRDFAELVMDWEHEFAPLNETYAPVEPPNRIKRAIDERLFPKKDDRIWMWRGLAWAAVFAAVIALAILPRIGGDNASHVARLTGDDFAVTARLTGDRITIAARSGVVPTGRSLELWVIAGDAAPVSLGLVGQNLHSLALPVVDGTTLAVSLEPTGGSPTGAPSGPVVATGPLIGL
ncbi:anti-sigma factor domain-containing protein [Actibacterium sp. 188UL27-1]|uniref:anti-sigma factor n=1 Tax=Actibacterium sp. 188UL27-1 TaxID=2786961 RepID=UPI0019571331|nr:anti-sigma factor [Actibacterium sp. 188UL27-1]MBM7067998.1 anti-sigma factor [Actibacterium sp. 188UL27-1]